MPRKSKAPVLSRGIFCHRSNGVADVTCCMDNQLNGTNGIKMTRKAKDKAVEKLLMRKLSADESFEIIESPGKESEYSNTIELYDALPKYVWDTRGNKRTYLTLS